MSVEPEDMSWEAAEIDRAFDYMNVMFGALLSAYAGVQIASENPNVTDVVLVTVFVFTLGIMLFSLRNLVTTIVQGLETKIWLISTAFTLASGLIGIWFILGHAILDRQIAFTIVVGWIVGLLLGSIGLLLRRWIKIHD